MLQKVVGGGNAGERNTVVDSVTYIVVAKIHFAQKAFVVRGGIFTHRIDPNEGGRGIGGILFCLQKMRERLVHAVVGHIAVGVIDGKDIQRVCRLRFSLGIDAGNGHGKIDVAGRAVISVVPRRIDPPRIVEIVAEGKFFVRKLADSRHMPHDFQAVVIVECRPWGVWRRGDVKISTVNIVKRNAV